MSKRLDQLVATNQKLVAENTRLKKENIELKARLNQDSGNTGKPPSSDPLWRRAQRKPKRKKSKRKTGGQAGHQGHKLKKFAQIDTLRRHTLSHCPHCSASALEVEEEITRQEVDIPLARVEVTEHVLIKYRCRCCGHRIRSGKELGLTQEVQYGPRLKALVSYLNVYQLMPYKRLTELIKHLYGISISQGSISNFNKALQKKLQPFIARMKSAFLGHDCIIHTDETGMMINKQVHWAHVYSDKNRTYLAGHKSRGKEAIDDINILPQATGKVVTDRYHSYKCYDLDRSFCNVHIIRNLGSINDKLPNDWPKKIIKLLLRAKEKKAEKPLTPRQIRYYITRYEAILREQRRFYQAKEKVAQKSRCRMTGRGSGAVKRDPDHNLFNSLWSDRFKVMRFITHHEVPFDNNQAERDLRMLKVKMKISNQFKSLEWATVYTDIRSFVATAVKQSKDVLTCITQVHSNHDCTKILAV